MQADLARWWRVLPLETGPAEQLLDAGISLLDGLAVEPVRTLRWYQAASPVIVLGRGQGRLLLSEVEAPVTMRYSGGGAVLLGPDVLALDLAIPAGDPLLDGQLGAVFSHVGRCWLEALRGLGLDDLALHDGPGTARLRGSVRERLLAEVCYATRGRGEVLWRGRKLVGLAQRRRRQGALVQCGLLRRWRPAALLRALGGEPADPEVLQAAAGLEDIRDDPPDDRTVMRAVEDALAALAGRSLARSRPERGRASPAITREPG